jgi:PAS domain S-box-containing protein
MTTGVSEIIEQEFELRGSKHLLLFHRTPWRDRAGRTIGVIGIATDITHRKARVRADADLAQLV